MIVGATDQEITRAGCAHSAECDLLGAWGHLAKVTMSMPTARAMSHNTVIAKAIVSRFLPRRLQGIGLDLQAARLIANVASSDTCASLLRFIAGEVGRARPFAHSFLRMSFIKMNAGSHFLV
jgi:hypothetical protein